MFQAIRRDARTIIIAVVAAAATAGAPAIAHGVRHALFAHNAGKLDGLKPSNVLPGGTLARGRMLRGYFDISSKGESTGEYGSTEFSFPMRVVPAPTPVILNPGDPSTSDCPGTHLNPKAAPGKLCVYLSYNSGATDIHVYDFTELATDNSSPFGATLYARPTSNGVFFFVAGTWAVKAGAGAPAPPKRTGPPAPIAE